jgi:hypothetical protein
MHASALATSRPAAFLPHKQAVRQAHRSSVKVMANFHSLSAKTLDAEAVMKKAVVHAPYVVSKVFEVAGSLPTHWLNYASWSVFHRTKIDTL